MQIFSKKGGKEEAKDGKSEKSFDELYEKKARLHSGSFGVVFEATPKGKTSPVYAVKIIDRARLKKKDDDGVFREVQIMRELLDVEDVVQVIDFFVEPETLYVVQDLARGGDVFDRLTQRKTYTELHARDLGLTLLKTMKILHERKIVHRDLKPENLLLRDKRDDVSILLCDFGFATHMREEGLKTRCGTPAFVAPEIVWGTPYDQGVDMWSVGCILYMLVCGYPPFQGKDTQDLFRKIRAADYTFHDKSWGSVSLEAKQLISNLLTYSPSHRTSASDSLDASWFKMTRYDALSSTDLTIALGEMKKFKAREKLRGTMQAVRWAASANFWDAAASSFSQLKSDKGLSSITSAASGKATAADGQAGTPAKAGPPKRLINKISFQDRYKLIQKIRSGTVATVWECKHKKTGDKYAVKVIKRKGLSPADDNMVLNEVTIMQSLGAHCKYVVELVDFYEEEEYFFMVMELMGGGDVFDRVVEKASYTEKDARLLVKVLLKAVQHLHASGIAHRDIKPQNLLLVSKNDDSFIKLCDFGFARRVHTPRSLTHRVGTPTYVAPEILKNIPHDQRADMWSVGVTMFVLLVGYAPFMNQDQRELFIKIKSGDWKFHTADWKHISEDAKELIRGLLVVDPTERWTAEQALRCKWIQQSDVSLSSRDLGDSLSTLKHKKKSLRAVAKTMIWLGKGAGTAAAPTEAKNPTQTEEIEDDEGTRKRDSLYGKKEFFDDTYRGSTLKPPPNLQETVLEVDNEVEQ